LNAEVNKALLYKTLNDNFAALSLEIVRMDRKELTTYVANEGVKWGKVVKLIGAKVD
jgi:tripartite-type tricarboxylate transporter receptor subunit TctC